MEREQDEMAQSGVPASNVGKSNHLNSNTDFSGAGVHSANTKHVPYAVRKGGAVMWNNNFLNLEKKSDMLWKIKQN